MQTKLAPRPVTESEWTWTILGLALLFGIFVRFLPGLLAGFPINDGGMFAVMMRDLSAHGYVLPAFTSYNFVDIPYAYPPLGFYIGAFFEWLGLSETQVLLWLPAFFTVLTVPLFYLLARELLGNRPRAALATAFFALAPGNYVWLLMGGGLTRALGTDFFILSLYFAHRAFKETAWRSTLFAIISCALVILSHPQMAMLTVMGCAIFGVFIGRSKTGLLHALVIAIGSLLFTSPWWLEVIHQHGLGVFLSAGQSGGLAVSLVALWNNLLTRQTIIPFATLFWLAGLFWAVYIRRFDLLVWGFLPFFIDQRSASIVASFLYPMLAAYGFLDVLPVIWNWFHTRNWQVEKGTPFVYQHTLTMGILGVVFYLLIECFVHAYVIRNVTLPAASQNMMAWVKGNTPVEAKFMILTGRADIMTDPVQEWFPALAGRYSATTLQGLEWSLGNGFILRWNELAALQACQTMECVMGWSRKMDLKFDYVVVARNEIPAGVLNSFTGGGYQTVFDNGWYVILMKSVS